MRSTLSAIDDAPAPDCLDLSRRQHRFDSRESVQKILDAVRRAAIDRKVRFRAPDRCAGLNFLAPRY